MPSNTTDLAEAVQHLRAALAGRDQAAEEARRRAIELTTGPAADPTTDPTTDPTASPTRGRGKF